MARILDGMTEVPAFVNNGRLDVLAANPLAQALYAPLFADPARPANHARFNFLNPRARDFWLDWERAADDTVAMLRTEAGRDPYDKALTDLVGRTVHPQRRIWRHPRPGRRLGYTEPGGFVPRGTSKSTLLTGRGRNR